MEVMMVPHSIPPCMASRCDDWSASLSACWWLPAEEEEDRWVTGFQLIISPVTHFCRKLSGTISGWQRGFFHPFHCRIRLKKFCLFADPLNPPLLIHGIGLRLSGCVNPSLRPSERCGCRSASSSLWMLSPATESSTDSSGEISFQLTANSMD